MLLYVILYRRAKLWFLAGIKPFVIIGPNSSFVQYTWGFGRQKALLLDYVQARTGRVSICAYLAPNSPQVELLAALKCLEIMDTQNTRLSFEYEGTDTQNFEKDREKSDFKLAGNRPAHFYQLCLRGNL